LLLLLSPRERQPCLFEQVKSRTAFGFVAGVRENTRQDCTRGGDILVERELVLVPSVRTADRAAFARRRRWRLRKLWLQVSQHDCVCVVAALPRRRG
jgi:hypothetical protein